MVDVAVILLAAFPLLFIGRRFRVPEVLSYIVTGIVIGPHALGFIKDPERVDTIAELGVALILFFIGLHVPLARLRALGRTAFLSGPVQMGLTALGVALITVAIGRDFRAGMFYGLLVALGSTAVVLPILTTRDEVGAPFARKFLGVSLFQDLAVIPLMLLVPAFAIGGAGAPGMREVMTRVVIAIVGVVVLIIVSRYVVPKLFSAIARLGRETFTAASLVLIVATIAIADRLGISPALGAFAAGLVVGDTDYIHEIEGVLRPFRDFLSALFFSSIGMLLVPVFVIHHPLLIVSLCAGVIAWKVLAAYPAFRLSPALRRTSVRAAFAIAPIGEFSFLLAQAGERVGLLGPAGEQTFVAVAVMTLAVSPLLVSAGSAIAQRIHEDVSEDHLVEREPLRGHIIIIGYGLNGQNVARVLVSTGLRHIVLEEDPLRIAAARTNGSRAIMADAADPHALEMAGIVEAVAVIVAISDPDGTRRIVRFCRTMNKDIRLIVRTRYIAEVERLRALGADEVIPEEFETSLEIVTRTLRVMGVPQNIVANQLRLLRDEGYRMLRDPAVRATDGRRLSAIFAAGMSQTYLILPDTFAEGRTIAELGLIEEGVGVAALLRDGKALSPLPVEDKLQAGDTMLLVGAHEDLTRAVARLERESGVR
ncbi:MAG: monovalent cation:H+ antiporter-2, family [Acidobacteriota bacterium]|nr:monovalent cation:H+ antiporter-2, family [Acidobacteriota bacterium]